MDNDSKIIRFVHYTAQEFFDKRRLEYFPNADIELPDVCLTYLTFYKVQGDPPRVHPLRHKFPWGNTRIRFQNIRSLGRKKRYSFLSYAAHNWGYHAQDRPEEVLQDKILAFLQNNRALSSSLRVQFAYEGLAFHLHRPLHVAVFFDLAKIVELLLQMPSVDLESEDEVCRTALVWAMKYRRIDMAIELIHRGADLVRVTRTGGTSISVLSLAIRSGLCDLVSRMLASAGAALVSKKEIYYAIQLGPLIVVETYIQSVPDAAGKRIRCNEILHRTAEIGTPQSTPAVFECAMTHGGDPEALDHDGCTVLLKAVEYGNSEAVRLLLSRGASASVTNSDGQSLLQIADASKEVFQRRLGNDLVNLIPIMFLPNKPPKLPTDALVKLHGLFSYPVRSTILIFISLFSQVLQEEEDQRCIIRQLLKQMQQQ